MDVISIGDAEDSRLDAYRRLNDVEWRRAHEASSGTFMAESWTVVDRIVMAGLDVRSVLCLEDRLHRLNVASSTPVLAVNREIMKTVVGFDLHRGVVASVARPPEPTMGAAAGHQAVAVLEGINDHQNLGSILRAAVALGVGAIVLDPSSADPWYRRAVRVSMGAVAMLPVIRTSSWPSALDDLTALGYTTVALSPRPDAVSLFELPVARPAFVLGAEGPGLSESVLAMSDVIARIPMSASMDSLNVGQAAAVAFAWGMR